MAYNFKSIADVEVVAEPSESANVLIEENGVIKKAPKTAVGGAGDSGNSGAGMGFGFDVVIFNSGTYNAKLSYGSYENLKSKMENEEAVLIALVRYDGEYAQYFFELASYIQDSYNYIAIYNANRDEEYQLYPDNTISINYIG